MTENVIKNRKKKDVVQKYSLCQNVIVLCVEMAEIFEKKKHTRKTHFFNTGPYGDWGPP